tara:strand:+ start:4048 stop:5877 length:1830 start_codon:yes stop_codon:yes gene_type:complete
MATTVDQLIVEIKAETKGLRQGLDQVNKKVGRLNSGVKNSIISFGTLAKGLAVVGFARLGGEIVNTSRTFEDLEATLRAITGSSEAAATSFDLIRKFTSGTTFQLENVSRAFITLVNAGITPTSGVLTDFGNVAAAFNKDITQLAQAAFNATTGEMEMLKQFGIVARLEGDKINVTFDGVTTQIDRNATDIIEFIRKIGSEQFPTALEDRADTVTGSFSNLKDATSELFNAIGEGGLNTVLIESARRFKGLIEAGKPFATLVGRGIAVAFQKLKDAVKLARDNLSLLVTTIGLFIAAQLGAVVIKTGIAFISFVRAVNLARIAMLAFNLVTKGNFLFLVALGIAQVTGGLEKLVNKVEEAIAKVGGDDGFLADLIGDVDTKSIDEIDKELEGLLGENGTVPEGEKAIKKLEEATQDLTESIVNSSHAFTREFVDALMEGESALESLSNLARNIVSEIISHFMRLAVINPILNAVLGGSKGFNLLPVFGSGTGTVSTTSNISSSAGSGMTGGLAGGGRIQAGRATIVGERGAEIFVPDTGGTILNNSRAGSLAGGSPIVVNQSINFSTGIVPTVRAEVTKLLPQISDVTKAAVLESAKRGGSFAKTLRGT